jgi:2-polyprenyl-3-methyl-5-hydroxy-6-metoxy-1,4-benzoquinol methylase
MKHKHNKEDMALELGSKIVHEGRRFMYDAVEKHHKKYYKKNKKSYKIKFLESRNCPLCNSNKYFHLFNKRGGSYVKCIFCSMIYLNPVFRDKELTKYYINMHNIQSSVVKNESSFYKLIYSKGLNQVNKFRNKGKNLIDIGCSSGFFLDLAHKYGWKTYGIEFNKKEKKLVNKKHVLFSQDIDTLPTNLKFDLVTMWDVIEHIKDGNIFLKKIHKKLNKAGLLFIQTPNASSFAARVLHEKCNVFDGIEHVNLYSFQTIKILAKKNGFKILNSESVISEIPIISNYLNYTDPYFGESEYKDTILGLVNEKKIHQSLLGYKMQVVLKKI